MENENITTTTTDTQTQQQASSVGRVGRSALAQAVFRATKREEAHKEPEAGTEPSSGDTENILLSESGFSTETEGDPQSKIGEEELTDEEYYEFGAHKFTPAELEAVLAERETYQTYNKSVKPLIDSLADYGTQFERSKTLAMTECEKTIGELKKAINSGRLDGNQHQAAYQQLVNAEARMAQLDQAARDEAQHRATTLNNARVQNARQVFATLGKQGWKETDLRYVSGLARQVVGDRFGDVLTPEFMQVFRDAAELRRAKEGAAKRLQAKNNTALKTTRQAPQKQQPKTEGKKGWGALAFGSSK